MAFLTYLDCYPLAAGQSPKMKNQESATGVNLFPIMALLIANLVAVCIGLFMLVGLHRKTPNAPATDAVMTADRIGEIKLDRGNVRINLMKFGSDGKIGKVQEVAIPQDGFLKGFDSMQNFIDKLVENGIVEKKE